MHEVALASSLVALVEAQARQEGARSVRRIDIELGALSHVDPGALRFAVAMALTGTLAEGATLEIQTPPGTATCFACGQAVTLRSRLDPCPACGSGQLLIQGGDAMRLIALEVI